MWRCYSNLAAGAKGGVEAFPETKLQNSCLGIPNKDAATEANVARNHLRIA